MKTTTLSHYEIRVPREEDQPSVGFRWPWAVYLISRVYDGDGSRMNASVIQEDVDLYETYKDLEQAQLGHRRACSTI